MDFELSEDTQQMQRTLRQFMQRELLPRLGDYERLVHRGEYPSAVIEPLKARARAAGLWNLFLPGLREDEPGTRLSNLAYAPLAEIMGRVPWASEVFNCNAPDTGNMELLHLFATAAQRERWLVPLLDGRIRSCFSMTEPDVASADATNIATTIRREGGHYVINGRKWFTTGAAHPQCRLAVVMGVTDESSLAPRHGRHSMVLVPLDTPGVRVVRNVPVMNHLAPDGHCEITYTDVRVPVANLLGRENEGFALAQARLGPGRVHHCMRAIGQCELAIELMAERALTRRAFGRHLADFANVQDWIAHSRVEVDQARLLVLQAAWKMDRFGNKAAHVDVSAIKLVAAQLHVRVLDRAMQVFGAMGLTPDTPLAELWSTGRAMRFFDGPDEVHLRAVAKAELARSRETLGSTAVYYRNPQDRD
ncbi:MULTISPECIES: acyl-CoA dehydrogenase family protein [Ramlibacter]|uniref:Acyl-CoA dehydrogenase family protein n=1 Tax=Ramlibacter aquaticus TaxID=2780094 RepID=A0ABR9SFS2_9BURK|nr:MULTISPECIES: acyl-CoA dehydrogenase family protein [Ramlibacter]MBE7941105.1 acyl-CoA dehydrogenase family protein [Ramlibacter aquaticus]